MLRRLVLLPALLAAASAAAAPVDTGPAGGADCGGDAHSRAHVVEGRPARRGPLEVVPDTLCADLEPRNPPVTVDLDAYVGVSPQVGSGGARVPYEDRSPRPGGPLRPQRP